MERGRRREGRPRTPLDLRWPDIAEYTELAQVWSEDAVNRVLAVVWRGYDDLVTEVLSHIDITEADEELERTITQILEPRIRRHLSGNEPYDIQHGSYEYATRQQAPAQPPQYDMAFEFYENPKMMWPLEAKILRSDRSVAAYARDVRNEFLTGRYAPYTNSGAMLGYLMHGSPTNAFINIEKAIDCQLQPYLVFSTRHHRISNHNRNLARKEFVSGSFRCHHLIMELGSSTGAADPS